MFALPLVAALVHFTSAPDVSQPVTIDFGAKGKVSVPRPSTMPGRQTAEKTYLSPRDDAAAVQFCWDIPTMSPLMCQVNLVRPGGQILPLKDGAVGPLLWTPDGKYLIGAGNNTVLLWNLTGQGRKHSPKPPDNQAGFKAQTNRITRIWFEGKFLCVAAFVEVFRASGGNSVSQLSMTTRYALPALKPLETVTMLAGSGETPCQPPHTEP